MAGVVDTTKVMPLHKAPDLMLFWQPENPDPSDSLVGSMG
jgi:hypothetical protein